MNCAVLLLHSISLLTFVFVRGVVLLSLKELFLAILKMEDGNFMGMRDVGNVHFEGKSRDFLTL